MSAIALTWAWHQKLDDAAAKLLLVKLADMANDHGVCWPGRTMLGEHTHLSPSTLIRKTRLLEAGGFLTVEPRKRPDGSTSSNLYRLPVEGAVTVTGPGRQSETPGGVTVTPPIDEPAVESKPSEANASSGAPAPFVPTPIEQAPSYRQRHDAVYRRLLVECYPAGSDGLTVAEKKKVAVAATNLTQAGGTAADVEERAARYRAHQTYGGCALTAPALANHWAELAPPTAGSRRAPCSSCGVGGGMHAVDCPTVEATA